MYFREFSVCGPDVWNSQPTAHRIINVGPIDSYPDVHPSRIYLAVLFPHN